MSILSVNDVTMRFGGVLALSEVNLGIEEGIVTGLIGPNGAGKTTLFNIITGLQPPTEGRVFLGPKDITRLGVSARARRGISRTFQKLEAFNSLSARDNILVAAEMRRGRDHGGDRRKPHEIADDLLEKVGLGDIADITVGTLPTGVARLVELARALATTPKVLLLDEPSSGLNEEETSAMSGLLGELAKEGLTVLLVEHDMSFVMGVSRYIFVLDFGQIIAEGTSAEIQKNPKVLEAYLGTAAASMEGGGA